MQLDSLVVQGLPAERQPHGAVNPPICLSSTFVQEGLDQFGEYVYSRSGNPTRAAAETLAAKVEGARFGFAFASGMAAISAVFHLFRAGDKILLNNNIYGGSYRYISSLFAQAGLSYELVDDFNALDWDAVGKEVKGIFVETPSNPLLRVVDLEKLSRQAKRRGILTIVDNTFMTAYLQRPLALGIDLVVYSATKYLSGHSDILAGLVLTDHEVLAERIKLLQKTLGNGLSPFDSYLLIRGMRTLAVRLDRHEQNAAAVRGYLQGRPGVEKLYYPGSYSGEEAAVQRKQAAGLGGVFSLQLSAGYDYKRFIQALSMFSLAVSLGGVESLVCHPATMTHEPYPQELRDAVGISTGLVRLAVGIENSGELISDLEQALAQAKGN